MAVAPDTAADLVYQIFDLQRAVRCIATANVRGQDTGVALQGVLRFVGEGEALTPLGAEKLRSIEDQRTAVLQDYLRDWSEEDAGTTAKILHKLTESLKQSARATAAGTITTTA